MKIILCALINIILYIPNRLWLLIRILSGDVGKITIYLRSGQSFSVYLKDIKLKGKSSFSDGRDYWESVSWESVNTTKKPICISPDQIIAVTSK